MAGLVIFHKGLIGFFRLGKAEVSHSAEAYLLITGTAGILFGTLNQIFTGICTGRGNSKLPFVVTSAGQMCIRDSAGDGCDGIIFTAPPDGGPRAGNSIQPEGFVLGDSCLLRRQTDIFSRIRVRTVFLLSLIHI